MNDIMTKVFVVPLVNSDKICLVDWEDREKVSKFNWRLSSAYPETVGKPGKAAKGYTYSYRLHNYITDSKFLDHKNRNTLDNRRCNLRKADHQDNTINTSKLKGVYSSKYKGVRRKRNKWQANIKVNQRTRSLGCFVLEENAALAYNKAAIKYFGEFAYLNVITPLSTT